jgi:hypothetical protein
LKTAKEYLLRGKARENAVLKTIVEFGTNPLTWIGLAFSLGPWGKVANPAQMQKLMSEGSKHFKAVSPYTEKFMSPFTSFRNLWGTGWWDDLLDVVRHKSTWQTKIIHPLEKMGKEFQKLNGRPMTSKEHAMVGAWLDGWHTPNSEIVSFYSKALGKGKVLAPALEQRISSTPGLMEYAKKARQVLDEAGKRLIPADIEKAGKIIQEATAKGVQLKPENYFPRINVKIPYLWDPRNVLGVKEGELRSLILNAQQRGPKGFAIRPRIGNSLPLADDLALLDDVLAPGTASTLENLSSQRVRDMEASIKNFMTSFRNMEAARARGLDAHGMKGFVEAWEGTTKNWGKHLYDLGLQGEMPKKMIEMLKNMSYTTDDEIGRLAAAVSKQLGAPARYSMKAGEAIRGYSHIMAPTYAWQSTGLGDKLDDIIAMSTNVSQYQREVWKDLRTMLQGWQLPKEQLRKVSFREWKMGVHSWLQGSPTIQKILPQEGRKWLLNKFSDSITSVSDQSIGGMITHAHHLAALGGNISPSSKNLFQPLLTTGPMVGFKNLTKGYGIVASRLKKMSSLVKKVGPEVAFKRAFPEYQKVFGHEHLLDSIRLGDVTKEGTGAAQAARGFWGKFQNVLMAPFSASEKTNRLVTFYAARAGAQAKGITDAAQLNRFAQNITMTTQFTGGTLGQPGALRGMWAPFRQFMHFPMRFTDYLLNSFRMGPEGQFSTGILGRGLLGSTAAYTIGKNIFDTDVSQALMFSAMPNPTYEGAPFYPFPLVPPAVSVAGSAVKAIHQGEYEDLPKSLALMLPGGLGVRKAYTTFAPKYADYSNRSPDGRIPIYNKEGALISQQSPMQLVMRGIGLRPYSLVREQEMTSYLLSQRDKIRSYRREYLEALVGGEFEKAQQVNQDFAKKYPELGPLQVKKSDIRAVKNRKQISRMHRIIKGFPKEYQGLFQEVVDQAALSQMVQDAEFDPSALELYLEPPKQKEANPLMPPAYMSLAL